MMGTGSLVLAGAGAISVCNLVSADRAQAQPPFAQQMPLPQPPLAQPPVNQFPGAAPLPVGQPPAGQAPITQVAEAAPVRKDPGKTYTNKPIFHLPVRFDERHRANLKELCLFVKSAGGGDWVQQDSVPPTSTFFTFRVPNDGEFWFSVAMVDLAGRVTPPEMHQLQPQLKVVADTKAPLIDVRAWITPEGEQCLKVQMQDPNVDPASLKVYCKQDGGAERLLENIPGQAELFRVNSQDLQQGTIRVLGNDFAGNVGVRDQPLRELFNLPTQTSTSAKIEPKSADPLGAPNRIDIGSPPSMPVPPNAPPRSDFLPPAPDPNLLGSLSPTSVIPPPNMDPRPAPGVTPASPSIAGRQLLNTNHATVEYRIEPVGPSGIGKVEAYITTDQGQTWQRFKEDTDKRSPLELDLPGEGVYGIRLAVTNGNGFGGTPPQRGDAPTTVFEVDTTAPLVQLRSVEPVPGGGSLEVRWTASDRNLGSEPVSLFYRTKVDGAWIPIVRNLKNDGAYRWTFPREQGSQFFVKIEVADQAGNIARTETPNAVVVDTTEPRATVVGVTGSSRVNTLPGN